MKSLKSKFSLAAFATIILSFGSVLFKDYGPELLVHWLDARSPAVDIAPQSPQQVGDEPTTAHSPTKQEQPSPTDQKTDQEPENDAPLKTEFAGPTSQPTIHQNSTTDSQANITPPTAEANGINDQNTGSPQTVKSAQEPVKNETLHLTNDQSLNDFSPDEPSKTIKEPDSEIAKVASLPNTITNKSSRDIEPADQPQPANDGEFISSSEQQAKTVFAGEVFSICNFQNFTAQRFGEKISIRSSDKSIPQAPFRGFSTEIEPGVKSTLFEGCQVMADIKPIMGQDQFIISEIF